MDAMISPMSIKEKGEEGTIIWWIKLKLVLDLWQNVEMPPHTWDNYLTGGWWNPGEWAMGANERRTKWHQSKMEEGMSGYIVVWTVACSGWCQTGCPHASTHVITISLMLGWWILVRARYLGIFQLVFPYSPTSTSWICTTKLCIALAKSTMKHQKKLDWKADLPWFSYNYWKCTFVELLAEYMGPSNCVHYEV